MAVDRLKGRGTRRDHSQKLEGIPSALVNYAEQGEFDQLVIGGGTLSPMGKIQLGPITEFVLLNAPTTVKLVR